MWCEIRSKNHYLFFIILIALILRGALPAASWLINNDHKVFWTPDTSSYVCSARGLIETLSFSCNNEPETLRSPGYPILLIPGLFMGQLEAVTIILQIFLGVGIVFLVYKIALILSGNLNAALFSATIYSIEPVSIIHCSFLMSDTFFTFALTFFVWYLLNYLKTFSRISLVSACLWLVASIYIRPVAYYLCLLVPSFLLITTLFKTNRARRQRIIHDSTLFFAVTVLLVGSWQVRNFVLTGYAGFSSAMEYNLYYILGSTIIGKRDHISEEQSLKKLAELQAAQIESQHGEERTTRLKNLEWQKNYSLHLIRENPGIFIRVVISSLRSTIFQAGFELLNFFNHCFDRSSLFRQDGVDRGQSSIVENTLQYFGLRVRGYLLIGIIVWTAVLLGIYSLSLLSLKFRFNPENLTSVCFLLIMILYVMTVPAITGLGYSRFRLPVMPLICVFSGTGLAALRSYFKATT